MMKHLALKLAALLVLTFLPAFHSAHGASLEIRQQEAVEPLLANGRSIGSSFPLELSFAAAQATRAPRACPEGMIFDTMVRQCSPLYEGCKTGETREADGRCSYTPQPPCKPGGTVLRDPMRCAYTPLSNYECLPGEKLNSDGTCGGPAEYLPCRSDEQQLPNNMCAYDPAKRTVCWSGDRILPDGRCQHPDGTMTYQTGCNANEQALENPPRCAYVRPAMSDRFYARGPEGCLPGEQLIPGGTCGSMQRGGCQSGELILSTHPLYPNIEGMCGREVPLQGGNNQAYFLNCRSGEKSLTLAGICAYQPAPVLRTTGYLPWRARLRRR